VHQLRAAHQAILVGKKTVLSDNPKLDVRHWKGKDPVRIVLGNETEIPSDFFIFNKQAETYFIQSADQKKLAVNQILLQLFEKNIISVLVEGGADVLQQFIDAGAWNDAVVITSDDEMNRLSSIENHNKFIQAPVITGTLEQTFRLENNTIQLFKNTHDLSFT